MYSVGAEYWFSNKLKQDLFALRAGYYNEHATKVQKSLQNAGIRAGIDLRNEKIGFKIREHTLLKVPYMLIIGDKEVDQNQATWRTRAGVDLGMVTIESVCDRMRQEILSKSININGGLSY